MRLFIVAYDIADQKRLRKVREVAYSYAFGGQKSAVESYLTRKELERLERELLRYMDVEVDRVNIVEVQEDTILLGKAKRLDFDEGMVVI